VRRWSIGWRDLAPLHSPVPGLYSSTSTATPTRPAHGGLAGRPSSRSFPLRAGPGGHAAVLGSPAGPAMGSLTRDEVRQRPCAAPAGPSSSHPTARCAPRPLRRPLRQKRPWTASSCGLIGQRLSPATRARPLPARHASARRAWHRGVCGLEAEWPGHPLDVSARGEMLALGPSRPLGHGAGAPVTEHRPKRLCCAAPRAMWSVLRFPLLGSSPLWVRAESSSLHPALA